MKRVTPRLDMRAEKIRATVKSRGASTSRPQQLQSIEQRTTNTAHMQRRKVMQNSKNYNEDSNSKNVFSENTL